MLRIIIMMTKDQLKYISNNSFLINNYNLMSTLELQKAQKATLGQLTEMDEQKNQTCQICNIFFKKFSHFNRHMRERHSQHRDHICNEKDCNKTFKRGSHLKRHMISHSNTKNYKCCHCIMIFGYKHHLDRHIRVIHLSERMECVDCSLKFIKKKAYNRHMIKHHEKTVERLGKDYKLLENNTNTKIGIQDQFKREEIYMSRSQQQNKFVQNQKQLYRCYYSNCISAFHRLYQFRRHLNRIHFQNDN